MLSKSSFFSLGKTEGRDQIFNLPLPTMVEGRNSIGRAFKEKTVLFYISHHGASFNLANSIALGEKLRLVIDLPSSLADNANLKLVINGRVALVEANNSSPSRQRVSLRFESKYYIRSDG